MDLEPNFMSDLKKLDQAEKNLIFKFKIVYFMTQSTISNRLGVAACKDIFTEGQ